MKLLRGITHLHVHGIRPPVTKETLACVFKALPALQVGGLIMYDTMLIRAAPTFLLAGQHVLLM